jgi:hypothetical protein
VRGENVTMTSTTTSTTDLVSGSSATSNAQHSAILQDVFNFTEAALMAHDRYLNINISMDEIRGLTRPCELLQAASEMGFELPRVCFEAENRSLSS